MMEKTFEQRAMSDVKEALLKARETVEKRSQSIILKNFNEGTDYYPYWRILNDIKTKLDEALEEV